MNMPTTKEETITQRQIDSTQYWYLLKVHSRELKIAEELKMRQERGEPVDYFIPEYTVKTERSYERSYRKEVMAHDRSKSFMTVVKHKTAPKTVEVKVPFLAGYVLVYASMDYLRTLDIFMNWMYPIVRPEVYKAEQENKSVASYSVPRACQRYQTIPAFEMSQFRKVIDLHIQAGINTISLHTGLVEGDQVKVVSGPFEGFQGTLITSQGKQGGRVVIKLSDNIYYDTLTIPVDNLEVISFSKHSFHIYKKFNAYNARILTTIEHLYSDSGMTTDDIASCVAFIRRYSNLQLDSDNAKVKYYAYMLLTHTALANSGDVESYMEKCRELLNVLRTELSKASLNLYMYIATKDSAYLAKAEEIADGWKQSGSKNLSDKKFKDFLSTLDKFKVLINK